MILFGDPDWLWPAMAIAAVASMILWWSYRGPGGNRALRLACASLKALAFVLLAVLLCEPLWSGVRARPGANLFLVLADNSQSLGIRDDGSTQSRGDALTKLLTSRDGFWQTRLEQDFEVRRYRFDAGLAQTDAFELDFDGTSSQLHGALSTLAERYRGRPVAGVLLFTDGNLTDAGGPLDATALPPVYPIPLGGEDAPRDLAIVQVAASQTAFEDAPVTVQADVSAAGFEGRSVTARVLDEQQQIVAELKQTVADDPGSHSLAFRFQLRPPAAGVSFYTVEIAADVDEGVPPATAAPAEATLENNRRLIQVDRGTGRKRVLYVSGRPNWEFKFLRRAIEDDPGLELAALIRIARREAKFDFRGRAGESSNPLFRGFQQDPDADTESFDEPVLVRLNMRDGEELRGGFPKTAEELFGFHAVILDDLEAGFFTHDQMELLEQYVSERGGGLLMLGGQDSFAQGGYEHTPVARLLPLYLDGGSTRRPAAAPAGDSCRLLLTREGWLQPWTRLRAHEADERQRLEEMPGFKTLSPSGGTKPGSVVLAEAIDGAGRPQPALVVQRYGHGRTAALTIGDLWRWQLVPGADQDDHGKAWRQALRWLVADVPERVTVEVLPGAGAAPDAVRIRVKALDASFGPIDNASVELTVQPSDGPPLTLHAEPSLDEPGVFETVYAARQPGACRVVATVAGENGRAAGTAESGWVSESAADEFRTVTPNRDYLNDLAGSTGGHVVEAHELDRFVTSLSARDVPITERWTYPLWHQAWVFALAVACLAGEWGLRRIKGLP